MKAPCQKKKNEQLPALNAYVVLTITENCFGNHETTPDHRVPERQKSDEMELKTNRRTKWEKIEID